MRKRKAPKTDNPAAFILGSFTDAIKAYARHGSAIDELLQRKTKGENISTADLFSQHAKDLANLLKEKQYPAMEIGNAKFLAFVIPVLDSTPDTSLKNKQLEDIQVNLLTLKRNFQQTGKPSLKLENTLAEKISKFNAQFAKESKQTETKSDTPQSSSKVSAVKPVVMNEADLWNEVKILDTEENIAKLLGNYIKQAEIKDDSIAAILNKVIITEFRLRYNPPTSNFNVTQDKQKITIKQKQLTLIFKEALASIVKPGLQQQKTCKEIESDLITYFRIQFSSSASQKKNKSTEKTKEPSVGDTPENNRGGSLPERIAATTKIAVPDAAKPVVLPVAETITATTTAAAKNGPVPAAKVYRTQEEAQLSATPLPVADEVTESSAIVMPADDDGSLVTPKSSTTDNVTEISASATLATDYSDPSASSMSPDDIELFNSNKQRSAAATPATDNKPSAKVLPPDIISSLVASFTLPDAAPLLSTQRPPAFVPYTGAAYSPAAPSHEAHKSPPLLQTPEQFPKAVHLGQATYAAPQVSAGTFSKSELESSPEDKIAIIRALLNNIQQLVNKVATLVHSIKAIAGYNSYTTDEELSKCYNRCLELNKDASNRANPVIYIATMTLPFVSQFKPAALESGFTAFSHERQNTVMQLKIFEDEIFNHYQTLNLKFVNMSSARRVQAPPVASKPTAPSQFFSYEIGGTTYFPAASASATPVTAADTPTTQTAVSTQQNRFEVTNSRSFGAGAGAGAGTGAGPGFWAASTSQNPVASHENAFTYLDTPKYRQ